MNELLMVLLILGTLFAGVEALSLVLWGITHAARARRTRRERTRYYAEAHREHRLGSVYLWAHTARSLEENRPYIGKHTRLNRRRV